MHTPSQWKILTATVLFALNLGFNIAHASTVSESQLWQQVQAQKRDVSEQSTGVSTGASTLEQTPQSQQTYQLDSTKLSAILGTARLQQPFASLSAGSADARIDLPTPDGSVMTFHFNEAPIMAPELAAAYPAIRTFVGRSVDNPDISVRFDSTPAGFHAQVLTPDGAWYVDPLRDQNKPLYASYRASDTPAKGKRGACLTAPRANPALSLAQATLAPAVTQTTGEILREYRLAVAATGEYTQFHGGTVAAALAAIVTTINRVNAVFEQEFAVRLTLINNNNAIIYTNPATDPFDGTGSHNTLASQSQSVIDATIGSQNYDIGHVFSTNGGGIAFIGAVCNDFIKGDASSGSYLPVGPDFDIDIVAHEMGHQFYADHSFNGIRSFCANARSPNYAFEPGSGSTIMSYSGLCDADDLQSSSDPVFHASSHADIAYFIEHLSGSTCGNRIALNNRSPTANAGPDHVIPARTPFFVRGTGSDPDATDQLSFQWEQMDLGPQAPLEAPDDGFIPLFRSYPPNPFPVRFLPRLASVIAGQSSDAEKLPQRSRIMRFRFTVRDGEGGVAYDDMQITVSDSAGPFEVTSPNGGEVVGGQTTVTWNPAGTNAAPVDSANVAILLSTDGGQSFDFDNPLVASTPNDGSAIVTLPPIFTDQARLGVGGAQSIFYDISNANFTITAPAATLIAPSGDTPTVTPRFDWNRVPVSSWYQLWVENAAGDTVVNHWYTSAEVGCDTADRCSAIPATRLQPGPHRWWIRTWANGMNGVWSNALDITISNPNALAASTPIAPIGTIDSNTPTYSWDAVAASTWYFLQVDDANGNQIKQWYSADEAGCATPPATPTCSVTPAISVQGSSQWLVQTWNETETGPWSEAALFSAPIPQPPSAATLLSPTGTSSHSLPTYTWEAQSTSTWYLLQVNDASGKRIKQWYTAADAGCASGIGTCSVTPVAEVRGDNQWWIRTYNPAGNGPWSSALNFTVNGAIPPATNLLSPSDAINTPTPTYRWDVVETATWYYLYVSDSAGTPIKTWYTAAELGCASGAGSTCTINPSTAVQGQGQWWVQTWNTYGSGPWSVPKSFVIQE